MSTGLRRAVVAGGVVVGVLLAAGLVRTFGPATIAAIRGGYVCAGGVASPISVEIAQSALIREGIPAPRPERDQQCHENIAAVLGETASTFCKVSHDPYLPQRVERQADISDGSAVLGTKNVICFVNGPTPETRARQIERTTRALERMLDDALYSPSS